MKINPNRYGKPQGQRLCCIQCGRTCRSRNGKVQRIYFTLHPYYPSPAVVDAYKLTVCRACLLRQGGLRTNTLGGIRLYDMFSGQPYDKHGMIPLSDYVDPWKADK